MEPIIKYSLKINCGSVWVFYMADSVLVAPWLAYRSVAFEKDIQDEAKCAGRGSGIRLHSRNIYFAGIIFKKSMGTPSV